MYLKDMATGLTDDGEKVVEKVMKESLIKMCQSEDIKSSLYLSSLSIEIHIYPSTLVFPTQSRSLYLSVCL